MAAASLLLQFFPPQGDFLFFRLINSFSVIETVPEIYEFPLLDLRPVLADSIADVVGMLN